MSRQHFLKLLDKTVGQCLCYLMPRYTKITDPVIKRIIIIRPGGIGDAVLLAPSINFLKIIFPVVHITVLAERRNAAVFTLIHGVDRLLCYDCPRELLQATCCSYEAVIDSEQFHRLSAVVARFVSAPVKIGFNTNERRRIFTHPIPFSQCDYEAVSFSHLLEPLGIETGDVEMGAPPFLYIPDVVFANTAGFLESLHNEPFVTLFPGASILERRWGAGRYRGLAEKLSAFGIKTVVVGGKEDRQQGEVIAGNGLGLNLTGMTSLAVTAAVIQKSALLISGDSGVLHIAVGLDIPTVSLFGPGRAKKWAPRGERHIVINKELPCSPCTTFGNTPPCPINAKCMSDITVEEVFEAVTTLLTRTGSIFTETLKKSE